MKIKLDETGKVISVLNTGTDDGYIDAPDLPSDLEFGVVDYVYLDGKYTKISSDVTQASTTLESTTYEQHVIDLIRQKYSLDEELAIQRQRDTKPIEFQQYFDYCEQCKISAKG